MAAQGPQIVTLEQALAASRRETIARHRSYVNPDLISLLQLVGFDRHFASARGCTVVDEDGREYLDFLGGYGALGLGHNHPEVVAAIEAVAESPNILQISPSRFSGALAESLSAIAPPGLRKTFFCNSGAEAVEGALKLARIASGRGGLVYATGSFHGKSFGALSVCGRRKYQEPFEPLVPGCVSVPFGDAESLRAALAPRDKAAFIIEPVQGEAGIIVPPDGYLAEARRLCHEAGTILIADEVQTGFGRTGRVFACEHDRVAPDILVLAKTLGGGVMPAGAFMASDSVWKAGFGGSERCVLHTSTFGGNARACAAALKTIEVLMRDDLAARASARGEQLLARLRDTAQRSAMVREVRGRGLMIGVEFAESRVARGLANEYLATEVAGLLLDRYRVITAYTLNNPNVIRFEPPLIVTEEEIDRVADAFDSVVRKRGGFLRVSVAMGARSLVRRIRR